MPTQTKASKTKEVTGHSKTTTPPRNKQSRQPGKEHVMEPKPEYIKPGYKASGKLQGKIALITGGDSGRAPILPSSISMRKRTPGIRKTW